MAGGGVGMGWHFTMGRFGVPHREEDVPMSRCRQASGQCGTWNSAILLFCAKQTIIGI